MANEVNEESERSGSAGYRTFSVIRKMFVYLFALFIVLAAVFFAMDKSPSKSFFGYRYYVVLTDSMIPEFASGDMVFVKLADADSIQVGDIITFNPSSDSNAYLTHRVTEKFDDYEGTGVSCFKTKGDANDSEDSFLIDEKRVIGTVQFHIPKLGLIIRFVQLKWYFVVSLIVLIAVFFHLLKAYFSLKNDPNKSE